MNIANKPLPFECRSHRVNNVCMMPTETVPRFPAIKSLHVPHEPTQQEPELPGKESEKKEDDDARLDKAASFITRVSLGSVHKQPRPGDVYRPRTSAGLGRFSTSRPLGLIPDRGERMSLLREMTRFFTPVPDLPAPSTAPPVSQTLPSISQTAAEKESESLQMATEEKKFNSRNKLTPPKSNAPISSSVNWSENKIQEKHDTKKEEPVISNGQGDAKLVTGPPISTILRTESPSPFRLQQYGTETSRHRATFENDPDYIELLANCNIKDYYGDTSEKIQGSRVHIVPHKNGTLGMEYSRRRLHTLPAAGLQWNSSPRMTKLSHSRKAAQLRERSFTVEYFNFSGQAKLWNKNLMDDRREALGYEPCERCRLRGGRCAKCKAIRTGGGYIILDENDLSDDELRRKFGNRFGFGDDEYCYGHGADDLNGALHRLRQQTGQDTAASKDGGGDGSLMDGDDGKKFDRSSGLGRRRGAGTIGGEDGRGGQGGDGDGDGDGSNGRLGRNSKATDGDMRGGNNGKENQDNDRDGLGLVGDGNADGRGLRGDEDDSGRYSNASGRLESRQSGSRPASTLGSRPGSSMRKFGTRRSGRNRKKSFGVERGRGHVGDGDSDGSDGEGRGGRRSRRRKGHGDDSDDEGDGKDRADYKFSSGRRGAEDDDAEAGSYANLMRFKKKRDDVKALHATMKELQGIDPLDYLARYCIIDQSKLPHYQHAYDNVDRDEDDEIDIAELDFALKAVNYNLITDAEMNYVHSILELAGRYKLNFRLFSLIAALSEKVVALEDMVKRFINKMDFEALEVKMKKCKELFYLLADTESSDHEGGIVTTNSLAVELQAGGLTEEHVVYVVDRLNHEDKGIVEFLDYLTYVPLFVEIHDTISGNPLDFSRTK